MTTTAIAATDHTEPTQSARILERLSETPGEWVPMPELYRVSGAYAVHSRVSELRGRGHDIEVRVTGCRPRMSEYRLVRSLTTERER